MPLSHSFCQYVVGEQRALVVEDASLHPVLCSNVRSCRVQWSRNGHIESFNGRLRDECLNVHQFVDVDDARARLEAWREDYNHHRPHSSLGHLTPTEYVHQRQVRTSAEAASF